MANQRPSVDQWLREARQAPGADGIGMYLTHDGVVRSKARAMVRNGDASALPVVGMRFSSDAEKVRQAVDRQTGLNRRKHSDAEILKTEESTGCHTCSHHDHSHGNGRTFPGKYPDDQNCTESQQEGQQMKAL